MNNYKKQLDSLLALKLDGSVVAGAIKALEAKIAEAETEAINTQTRKDIIAYFHTLSEEASNYLSSYYICYEDKIVTFVPKSRKREAREGAGVSSPRTAHINIIRLYSVDNEYVKYHTLKDLLNDFPFNYKDEIKEGSVKLSNTKSNDPRINSDYKALLSEYFSRMEVDTPAGLYKCNFNAQG